VPVEIVAKYNPPKPKPDGEWRDCED
jgi:hypothetical protein